LVDGNGQIQEHRAAIEYHQAAMEAKQVEHHQVVDQIPLYGEHPCSVLQLATFPPDIQPYHLQLAQPSFQD
jgi:hypothetical protein